MPSVQCFGEPVREVIKSEREATESFALTETPGTAGKTRRFIPFGKDRQFRALWNVIRVGLAAELRAFPHIAPPSAQGGNQTARMDTGIA